jgi:uncharacterized protein YdaL
VPFSVAVIPIYRDPLGIDTGQPREIRLSQAPAVVDALKYMVSKGGTLLMHGVTHQYGDTANPINGKSGTDWEFFLTRLASGGSVQMVSPVPDDSRQWALDRLDQGLAEFRAAGLPVPTIFEFPHYIGSPTDYRAVGERFATRYERTTYFPGILGGPTSYDTFIGSTPPYATTDLYGSKVLPENLGYVISGSQGPDVLVNRARSIGVVRDAVASFFYHPYLAIDGLKQVVQGLKAQGYTFVAPTSL